MIADVMLWRILLVFMLMGSAASAQVIYEPIHYQYSDGHRVFYYGGSNPQTIARGCVNDWLARGSPLPPAVYIDALPLWNAAWFGYTPDDAHNAARLAMPRYFDKRDLLSSHRPASLDDRCVSGQ
jgi:hypothetical protein